MIKTKQNKKFANPEAGMTMETLTDRDGKQANTIAQKEEVLRQELFPPNKYDLYFELPQGGQAHQSITEQTVERAPFSQSVKNAPGRDTLCFGALRLLWKWDKERSVELAKGAVRTGRHATVWRQAGGVVILTRREDNYTKLMAFRSFSLLSCMGKVVQNVVAELLAEEAVRSGPLSDGQFGSRKARSAIDTAAIMVDSTHAAYREGTIASVVLMDINAAFPSVGRERLFLTMKARGIDRDLI
jgi:hypothetical protein